MNLIKYGFTEGGRWQCEIEYNANFFPTPVAEKLRIFNATDGEEIHLRHGTIMVIEDEDFDESMPGFRILHEITFLDGKIGITGAQQVESNNEKKAEIARNPQAMRQKLAEKNAAHQHLARFEKTPGAQIKRNPAP